MCWTVDATRMTRGILPKQAPEAAKTHKKMTFKSKTKTKKEENNIIRSRALQKQYCTYKAVRQQILCKTVFYSHLKPANKTRKKNLSKKKVFSSIRPISVI